ncbi:FCD domain-containing protein [Streptomyces sp. NPDC059785]|uniref:FCD domain-containing protein n=1 Tax=Streptomyces sp. NPDC059785 TaxID=3346945 RepID=UPI003661AA73
MTTLSPHDALELITVMELLTCAGVAWSVPHVTDEGIAVLRDLLDRHTRAYEAGDLTTAALTGAAFSRELIAPAGNRELLTHIDLVVSRYQRILFLVPDDGTWRVWRQGYADVLAHLTAGEREAAVARYRRIHPAFRAQVAGTGQPPRAQRSP